MRTLERDGLLLVLATASGSADGWSFFGFGHAFVANMTGNTVMIGISIFHLPSDLPHPLVALVGYVLGTILGTLISRRVQAGSIWAKQVSWTLLLEFVLLIVAEAVWLVTAGRPSPNMELALLGWIALAIGLQSGAMIQLGIPGVVTTYISGTWTTFTSGVTLLATGQPRVLRQKRRFEERFELQGAILAVYLLSAVLTGWAFRHNPGLVGGIPAIAVGLAAAYGALRA